MPALPAAASFPEPAEGDMNVGEQIVRVTVFVRGAVQGVGFRWWTRARALELGLVGHARNTDDGRVEVVVQGPRLDCAELVRLLGEQPTTTRRPGCVRSVSEPQIDEPRHDITGFAER
jgi:acylphosphatase